MKIDVGQMVLDLFHRFFVTNFPCVLMLLEILLHLVERNAILSFRIFALIRAFSCSVNIVSPLHRCRSAQKVVIHSLVGGIPCVFCIADTRYLLHFPPHGKDGLADIGVGHLIHVHCLDDLIGRQAPNGIGQPVQRVDAADADEQLVFCEESWPHRL